MKLVFREKHEFYLFYYDTIFKDHVLFRQTQSRIEIDAIVVKNMSVNFVEKYVRLK